MEMTPSGPGRRPTTTHGARPKIIYDQRLALSLTVAELAGRAGMTVDEIESREEGGTEPTLALLRHLAALNADVHLTAGQPQDTTSVLYGSNPTQLDPVGRGDFRQAQRSSPTATFSVAERLNNRLSFGRPPR